VLHFMLCFSLSLSVQTGGCASLHAVFHFVAVCTNWWFCFTSCCVSVCRCLYKLVVVFHFMLCVSLSLSVQTGGCVSFHAVFQFVAVCTNWWLCFISCCVSVCRCLYKLVVLFRFMLCFSLSLSVQTGGCVSLHAVFQFVAVCTNMDFMTSGH